MRLFVANTARRFIGLIVLLFFALPFGLSVTGCGHKSAPVQYCNAGDSGPVIGQIAAISLSPSLATTGETLNYGQIGTALTASATDCKGTAVAVKAFTYSSTSSYSVNTAGGPIVADINPSSGAVCGGTWNRNSSGGVPNYTTCTAPSPLPPAPKPVAVSVPAMLPAAFALQADTSVSPPAYTYTVTAAGMLSIVPSGDGTVSSVAITINGIMSTVSASVPFFVIPSEIVTVSATTVPTVTLTPAYSYTASSPGALQIIGGTVSAIYDYVAVGSVITKEPSTSGIFAEQAGDFISVFYTKAPTVIFTPGGVAAYVTASANGAVSNAIPVFVHPVATGAILGAATADCSVDPGSDCCPNDTASTPVVAPVYAGSSCLSQTQVGQLVARVYQNGGTTAANNITCQVGHLTFAAQTPSIVTIDQNGAATAEQPGSTVITATISNSSSATNAGFFSTCPPANITLAIPGQPDTNSISVAINNLQPLTATVTDTQNNTITGLTLEFNSTTPQTIPGAVGSVTPLYPGSADITAVCQPPTCNAAPFSQIGLFGNGKPITSNPITINSVGSSSTVLYMGSTSSQYIAYRDFTTNQPSALIKLPYVPNSMVMNQAGTVLYLGSSGGLISVTLASNTVATPVQTIQGTVLSVSPDGNTLVVTDPTRQTISLVTTSNNTVSTSYNGVGTSASWSPDDQTVYITTTNGQVLSHSVFTDWQTATSDEVYTDVAVMVPSIGAYFAGPSTTDGRSYCPSSSVGTSGNPPAVANIFLPLADQTAAPTDQIAATTDGNHIVGAHATGGAATFSDIDLTLPPAAACPTVIPTNYFPSSVTTQPLVGVSAGTITGVVPSSNSAAAFVTYTAPTASSVTNALLPLYIIPSTGKGTLQYLTLGNGATPNTAPVSGVFSTDNFTFYAGTSGDNQVHLISLTYPAGATPTAAETSVLTPQLPVTSGPGYAPVNLIAQHPKKSTS